MEYLLLLFISFPAIFRVIFSLCYRVVELDCPVSIERGAQLYTEGRWNGIRC